jgi:ATP-dependent Clp protease adaptor protein ClpS
MPRSNQQSGSSPAAVTRVNTCEPEQYNVLFHNDDFTTMDFVVMVLEDVFDKTAPQAEAIMLQVHEQGCAVVGTYTYDMAMTRAATATHMAREQQFPLRITVEQA